MARTTISLDGETFKKGVKRARTLKYKTFSAYVEHLVARDVQEQPIHVLTRQESETRYENKPREARQG